MEIKEINNKEVWESFLEKCREKTFLDSWNWGEFQKKEGNKIWRWGIYSDIQGRTGGEQLLGVALVVKIRAKRGTFLFLPHGPNVKKRETKEKKRILEFLTSWLKKTAKEEKADFIRIAPIWEKNNEELKIFQDLGFKKGPIHIHPETTWELNLEPSEEDILMNMRKTTRYLIRRAEKNSAVEVVKSVDVRDLKNFEKIYRETADRHYFVPFSSEYLKNQFLSFASDGQILIFLGKYKNEVVSSAVVVFWQDRAFYHHGASSLKHQKIPVSYLIQWEAIKEAKRRNCRVYNFWGVVPEISDINFHRLSNIKKHPWYGLSLFKKGFGGYLKEYLKTQDMPLSLKYYLTWIFEKIRKIKRRL